jgi:putative ABC transport system ATP-binding protein
MAALVHIEDLSKRRAHGGTGFQLRVPQFSVQAGEFVALVGDSGSGKSTLLDMLALVLRPTTAMRFDLAPKPDRAAHDVLALWREAREGELAELRRRALGYVLQTGGLLPFLTVADNLRLPLRINRLHGREPELLDAAERMGVVHHLARKPDCLSGGERQRVAILRALLHGPALVLADEPTAAVDKRRARSIVADFRALARPAGTAIVMVTHDLELVREVADRGYRFTLTDAAPGWVDAQCVPS